MAKADIEITLHGGEAGEFGIRHYHPGETLTGTATIFPDDDINCKNLFVRLQWHTEGRGTVYSQTDDEINLFQGTLKGGYPTTYDFEINLPREPWSFYGHYISIVWEVEVQLDVPWARDVKQVEKFAMVPLLGKSNEIF